SRFAAADRSGARPMMLPTASSPTEHRTEMHRFNIVSLLDRVASTTVPRGTPRSRDPSPILATGVGAVLEIIDLPDLRDVVRQDLLAAPEEVLHWSEARECLEVADQVRLVEVAALHGDPRPVRRRDVPHQCPGPLKSAHSAVELRRQADLGREHLD